MRGKKSEGVIQLVLAGIGILIAVLGVFSFANNIASGNVDSVIPGVVMMFSGIAFVTIATKLG